MTRAVIYARYSSDNQSQASIEDQVRQCRAMIEQQGWTLDGVYSDAAISGATTLRPGYQKMLEDARNGGFDTVVAEALDRLSRDQEDVAGLFKQLSFATVRLVTLAEGEITELHVGLKGTMNALYLKDLAQKTRRGLEGRVRQGKSGGGKAYGYDVVDTRMADGTSIAGERAINGEEAAIVRRIFQAFADGQSPKTIAQALNREGVTGPSGGTWGPSTIYGNWRRGTGILNNDLYVGRLIWNRQRFVKDPSTGRRQARMNPENEWIVTDVLHLRIIDDGLWTKVKERQQITRQRIVKSPTNIRSEQARRPRYLLSGLITCGECGGGFSMNGASRYACSNARNRGTCSNHHSIRRDELEARVLDGLRTKLMHPDLVKEFIDEFHREFNRLAAERDHARNRAQRDLERTTREIGRIIQAIKDGVPAMTLKDELMALEARKADLERAVTDAPAPIPRLHPNLAEVYRRKVADLHEALNTDVNRAAAAEALRALIDEIRLTPKDGELRIELFGDLAALLALTHEQPRRNATGLQVTLVAGRGFEPLTFRL